MWYSSNCIVYHACNIVVLLRAAYSDTCLTATVCSSSLQLVELEQSFVSNAVQALLLMKCDWNLIVVGAHSVLQLK
jgi:hypothetical protein